MSEADESYTRIGSQIRRYRTTRGMSMADLAGAMGRLGDHGVSAGMIGAWERGQRAILAHHLEYAARALGADVRDLYADPRIDRSRDTTATRVAVAAGRLTAREQQTVLYVAEIWPGDARALMEWIRMYVALPAEHRAEVSGLAINQVRHLIADQGVVMALDVDLDALTRGCNRIG